MDLVSLRFFVRVVEEGTISQAAQREHIAAAAISRRIADLEDQLGTPLLRRTNKGVHPTQAGMELLYRARSILNSVQDLKSHLQGYSQGQQGHIHLLANISVISQHLPHILADFISAHPGVQLKIEEKNSLEIVYEIEKSQADIGIYTALPHDADIESYFFRHDHLGVLVPLDHDLAQFDRLFFEQCLDYDHIILRAGTQLNYQITKIAMEANRSIPVRAEIDSYEAMCLLVNAGMGIGVLPHQSTKTFQIPNTRFVWLNDAWAQRELLIGVRRKKELSPSAKILLEFLQNNDTTYMKNI